MDFFDFKNIYIYMKNYLTTMTRIKTYKQFKESLTLSVDQLPSIGDIVDKVNWKEGEKIAFIDFKGIKNIPVHITNNADIEETKLEEV